MAEPPRWAVARTCTRQVGEPVAAVIAETREQALDAAEQLVIDYETKPAVVDWSQAIAAQASLHAEAPGNVCFRWARGDEGAVRKALQSQHM